MCRPAQAPGAIVATPVTVWYPSGNSVVCMSWRVMPCACAATGAMIAARNDARAILRLTMIVTPMLRNRLLPYDSIPNDFHRRRDVGCGVGERSNIEVAMIGRVRQTCPMHLSSPDEKGLIDQSPITTSVAP